MAITTLTTPVETLTGRISPKEGIVFRRKNIRDEKGNILCECKQEIYKVKNPRDFVKTPPVGEEAEHFRIWTEACRRGAEEAKVGHPKYAYWRERWEAQLKKPDPMCPVNKKTKTRKCYYRFDCFVRVAIRWELNKGL